MLLAPWIMRPFGYEGAEGELVVNLSQGGGGKDVRILPP